jgi:hypothetical protein
MSYTNSGKKVGWGYAAKQFTTGAVPADRIDFLRKANIEILYLPINEKQGIRKST